MEMIEVDHMTLSGHALNWAVMKADGIETVGELSQDGKINWYWPSIEKPFLTGLYDYAAHWTLSGPLLDKYDIDLESYPDEK